MTDWRLRTTAALLASVMAIGTAQPVLAQAAAQPAPASRTAPWPHTVMVDQTAITVYQPQAIAWTDHATLQTRTAIQVAMPNGAPPAVGVLEMTVKTTVDPSTNMVVLSDPQITATRFPALDTGQAAQLDARIRAALPNAQLRPVPLNAILLSLKQTTESRSVAVNNDPPAMFYSDRPASLVVFDGEPVMTPIGATGLSYAVNTNWPVFSDGTSWWMLNGTLWLSAPAYAGPWQPTTRLPPPFGAIPNDPSFADVKKAIPPKPAQGPAPAIVVSTKPAEMIVTDGPPKFVPVPGTGLQTVTNASSDLFFDPAKGQFYYLTSGRWFSAGALNGPWTFASNRLPPDFQMIDPQGNQGHVLASVPNTAQAQAAVLKAQIPQQGTLKRSDAKLTVAYGGAPNFVPIPGTQIRYATNTNVQVLEVEGRYYACYQGAWFTSASPNGPWVLAESVPQAVYSIPPSSPMYPVTYVTVQSYNPQTVTYAYTSGYLLGFVTAGLLVYGTGFWYPPFVVPGRVPGYFPYPYSYAGRVYYNPANGAWARGGAVYGPYGAARGGAAYNPTTGAWARGGAVYGPNGGAGAWSAYNPSTGTYARGAASWNAYGGTATASAYNARTGVAATTTQNTNMYQRWGSSTVSTPTRTVDTASASGPRGSVGAFQSSTGASGAAYNTARGQGAAVKTPSGDVYAGRDGNVYQHSSSGWSTWNSGQWAPVQHPDAAANQARTAPAATQPRAPQAPAAPRAAPQTIDRGAYNQLEQDRTARWGGAGGFAGRPAGAAEFRGGGGFRR